MPLDTKNSENHREHDISAIWAMPAALLHLSESGDADLVNEVIALFQEDTSSRMEVLQQALSSEAWDIVRAEAHTLKGSALQVGANRVASVCRSMELSATQASQAELQALFVLLEQRFEEVCRVIAELGDASSPPFPP